MGERMGWSEFWPFYLEEHNRAVNRWMHFIGTSIAFALIVTTIVTGIGWFLLGALLAGYAFAWVGHFVFQGNRPATFRYPIKSFASDWRLWALMLVGRANAAYDKYGVERR